jgi:ubiquinone/menaquinone biosynthesis C-methylase UbiE
VKQDPNVVFEGAVPEHYDRHLGPAFFEPFARDIISRLNGKRLEAVLEIACGTGIVTRRLRDVLPSTVRIVASDLNQGMFEFARRKFKVEEQVHWQQADASALPFSDSSYDAVVCQFGLMFIPDKEAAIRECYRVLRSGGILLFNVWDSFDANPICEIAHKTIASFFEYDPPNFYELPFGFYDAELIRALLRKAGFVEIESSAVTLPCQSTSASDFATGLVRGNPVATAIAERGVDPDDVIDAVSKRIAERYGSAPVESTMRALVWRALRQ